MDTKMDTKSDCRQRRNIHPGAKVRVVQKKDQNRGLFTEGIIHEILTNAPFHPHGIKVRLKDGSVGRVQEIC
jgi:uncharacterized repeat protein (TIGR03833 family)